MRWLRDSRWPPPLGAAPRGHGVAVPEVQLHGACSQRPEVRRKSRGGSGRRRPERRERFGEGGGAMVSASRPFALFASRPPSFLGNAVRPGAWLASACAEQQATFEEGLALQIFTGTR